MIEKPLYRVPLMAEIEAIPDTGLRVVSTFSGCGGSCLGYRMAGMRVLWASEFVPAAAEVYQLNHPDTHLDTRDIRDVTAADIKDDIGGVEVDLLDGSPPCASFSRAGRRSEHWGLVREYSDRKQRTDDLFFEFTRILAELQPRTFIAENVAGLVQGSAKGYFKEILAALRAAGYVVAVKVLDAQWLGVPQVRRRVIFQGVREDIGRSPAFPTPFPYRYVIRDVLPDAKGYRYDTSRKFTVRDLDINREAAPTIVISGGAACYHHQIIASGASAEFGKASWRSVDKPVGTIGASPSSGNGLSPAGRVKLASGEYRRLTIEELKIVCAFPPDFQLVGTYVQQWERLGRAVPPLMMKAIAETVRDRVLCAA